MRRRWWLVGGGAAVVVVAVVVVVVVFVVGGGPKRYEAEGFAFSYPAGWEVVEGVDFPLAVQYGRDDVGENTVGMDLENWMTVFVARTGVEVGRGNVQDLIPAQRTLVRETVAVNPGARVLQDPFVIEEAGLVGTRYRIAARGQRGQAVEQAITTLWDGATTYVFNCQWRPGLAVEMAAGCEQVFESFEVVGGEVS